MLCSFGNQLTKDLVEENFSKAVRQFPKELIRQARKKLLMIHAARQIQDLVSPPGNHLEKLNGNRLEYYSIRINDQWRITFRFKESNAFDVSVEDYHK